MRYLVTQHGEVPFVTDWFDVYNHYNDGMTIYDLFELKYTTDGIMWASIEEDHL